MAAPEGNTYWTMRATRGRPLKFETPADLWDACVDYFEWVTANPLKEAQAFSYQGDVTLKELPKMRAMTIVGLCIFLGISATTWRQYGGREEFAEVVERAEAIIRTQKFEGAAAGLLTPNIIARDLGLSERQEVVDKTPRNDIEREPYDRVRGLGYGLYRVIDEIIRTGDKRARNEAVAWIVALGRMLSTSEDYFGNPIKENIHVEKEQG